MHYDPVTPFNNILNNIEDLLKYRDMENCPYSQPQAISKAYNILNKTGKFSRFHQVLELYPSNLENLDRIQYPFSRGPYRTH